MTQSTGQPQSPIQVVPSPGPDGLQVGVVAAAGGLQVLLRIHVDQADQIADAWPLRSSGSRRRSARQARRC
jgi:hypothetical protein